MKRVLNLFPCMREIQAAADRYDRALERLASACESGTCPFNSKIVTPPPFDDRHLNSHRRKSHDR